MRVEDEIIERTQSLLDSVSAADWESYQALCCEDLTAYEPETHGHLIEGLAFHKYYFDLEAPADQVSAPPSKSTIAQPYVRVIDDVAIIAYTRVVQSVSSDGTPGTSASQETRVWLKSEAGWKNAHFHRSQ